MLSNALHSANTPQAVQKELRSLLSCIHKDMPESVRTQLATDAGSGSMDERSLGFALGNLSEPWQQDILRSLLSRIDRRTLGVLARAIWRDEGFVRAFGVADLDQVTRRTLAAIKDANGKPSPNKREVASFTRYCELLLGLLRSRDSEDPKVRMLLQPHQAITKELAEQVERAIALIAQACVRLKSRVQVANLSEKPEGEDTPDLLYALRLYLAGDVGANAIRVTGVNHGEDD
jgi:predicted transcriptional regulator